MIGASLVLALTGCAPAHDPAEAARKLQQLDEAVGHPLAHMPGLPISDRASDECLAAMAKVRDIPDDQTLHDETLSVCVDVPEWAYALYTQGDGLVKPEERPLVMTLETVCRGKAGLRVCDDGRHRGIIK